MCASFPTEPQKLPSFHHSGVTSERGVSQKSASECVRLGVSQRQREGESPGMWKPCRGNNLSHITEPTEVCGSGELSNKIQLTTKGSLKK